MKKKPTKETPELKERPILFQAPMVMAILAGVKTQTRRIILPQPLLRDSYDEMAKKLGLKPPKNIIGNLQWNDMVTGLRTSLNPHGWIGDELWVREAAWYDKEPMLPTGFRCFFADGHIKMQRNDYYGWAVGGKEQAGFGHQEELLNMNSDLKKRPSIHMNRWASRIQLLILGVRAERIQDITDKEILAEGIPPKWGDGKWHSLRFPKLTKEIWDSKTSRQQWEYCWNSINAKRGFGWDVNPWVWVIEFRRLKPK